MGPISSSCAPVYGSCANKCRAYCGPNTCASKMDRSNYLYVIISSNRIIKEAMRSSGANATFKHLEDVSLGAFFLLDVAKRVDTTFGVPQSSRHTIRDTTTDVKHMVKVLREEGVTMENPERKGDPFEDPLALGSKKVAEGRLDKYLSGCFEDDLDDKEAPVIEGEINFDYELFDVV